MNDALLFNRFRLLRPLGTGGFGAVFEAYDRERGARVALKRLVRVDPTAVWRFKQEFRALADVKHPSLVRLHELFCDDGEWYLTMDLVVGVDFLSYVRERATAVSLAPAPRPSILLADTLQGDSLPDLPVAPIIMTSAWRFDEERLRASLSQLVAGVQALHEARRLHRDLKPSNVLVTPTGHVVVLDFGLVAELQGDIYQSYEDSLKGTPAYMAPEQANDEPVSPASDWYAVGVMLYEALTGHSPFTGTAFQMLYHKSTRDAPDPRVGNPDTLPDDLVELALALLSRESSKRPTGDEILQRCSRGSLVPVPLLRAKPRRKAPFVGRDKSIAALHAALGTARGGKATIIHLKGRSGMGKSALARRFLAELEARPDTVVLAGRCHAREEVPFKAFDGVIDALTFRLMRMKPEASEPIVDNAAPVLSRLFHAFARLIPEDRREFGVLVPDALELRRQAFAALRGLLSRLCRLGTVVLFVDDIQWGDADSAALLIELLAPPSPPPILLIACHRSEEVASSPMLRVLRDEQARGALVEPREVDVGPLDELDARALASALFDGVVDDNVVARVARESEGNPLFVHELVRFIEEGGAAGAVVTLPAVLSARIDRLSVGARGLLDVVALAGHPIEDDLARNASGLQDEVYQSSLDALLAASLVRTGGAGARRTIETLHDAIRDATLSLMTPPVSRELHRRLAKVLASDAQADPESLAVHLRAVGDYTGAQFHDEQAADRAADALAFDRAAALYRRALAPPAHDTEFETLNAAGLHRLRVKLGDVLAHAGRAAEAARAYLSAAPLATPTEALELQRKAAEQLLRSGHIDEGTEVIRTVLGALGMTLPDSPQTAALSVRKLRAEILRRGFWFTERQASSIAPQDLARMDVCWSIGNGLGGVSPVVGAEFHARHVLLALEAGEPYRIARALAWEAILAATEGALGVERAESLAERAESLAERTEHPHALGWAVSAAAVTAFCEGRWRRASQLSEYGAALFRERCVDIAWEVGELEIRWNLPALHHLGRIEELERRAASAEKEAIARGDLYALTNLRTAVVPLALLVRGKTEESRAVSTAAIGEWSTDGTHLQHWFDLMTQCRVDLYEGDGARCFARIDLAQPALAAALLEGYQTVRFQTSHLRALGALGLARMSNDAPEARRRAALLAAHEARKLVATGHPWARALGWSVVAGVLRARGSRGADTALTNAIEGFAALEMPLCATAGRWLLCIHRGDFAGAQRELTVMEGRGVKDPARWAGTLFSTL